MTVIDFIAGFVFGSVCGSLAVALTIRYFKNRINK